MTMAFMIFSPFTLQRNLSMQKNEEQKFMLRFAAMGCQVWGGGWKSFCGHFYLIFSFMVMLILFR